MTHYMNSHSKDISQHKNEELTLSDWFIDNFISGALAFKPTLQPCPGEIPIWKGACRKEVSRSCFVGGAWNVFSPKKYQF